MTRQLAHLTWTDVRDLDKTQGVVILPVGAVEQHGPHLPLITDTVQVTRVLDAALERVFRRRSPPGRCPRCLTEKATSIRAFPAR